MYANLEKCEVWLEEVKFLGHVISKEGITVDPSKVEAVVFGNDQKQPLKLEALLDWQDTTEDSSKDSQRL